MQCALFLLAILNGIIAYNIDTLSPYILKGDQDGSFFGFSTNLHIYEQEGKKYVLVGAPKANWTSGLGSSIPSPGAVYSCLLPPNLSDPKSEVSCDEQVTYLEDNNSGNADDEDKQNQWLGVNVQSSNEFVSACAHRYVWKGTEKTKRLPIGKCIVIGGSLTDSGDDVQRKILSPCKEEVKSTHEAGSCQVGSSEVQRKKAREDKNTTYLFYGAPGEDIWEGGAYLTVNLKDAQGSKNIDQERPQSDDFNQYNGYATAICSMSGKEHPIDFITSAPRANNYLGQLYFFNSNNKDTNERKLLRNSRLNEQITGDQMGAYFGYSMACGDLNKDGYDDLIVSAPWYSRIMSAKSSIISVGRIYVFNGAENTVISNAKKPTIIDAPSMSTSAFGLGLAHVGDINQDGFQDFAVGAPYENDYQGAIYIYHGSWNGIRKVPSQIIRPDDFSNGLGGNLKTFGWSISGNKDMDNNNYADIAVGAYKSDRVVYLRALPIVGLKVEIIIPSRPVDLTKENMNLGGNKLPGTTLKICFSPLQSSSSQYDIEWKVYLDYKKFYAPRAYFQDSIQTSKKYDKSDTKRIDMFSSNQQCTATYNVYLKKDMFDFTYIEVNMTANIKESKTFSGRAVLDQEKIDRAKGKIVIKSACASEDGICQCDIKLHKPSVQYYPIGYNSVVLDYVKKIVVKYEVENLGTDNAHIPTLRLKLPPKVYFIRRTPVDDQTEQEVSQILCSEIEEDKQNYVECFLSDPLEVNKIEKFGISLSTQDLTDTSNIVLHTEVYIGSPSEEAAKLKDNNVEELSLSVGRQANLEIRGTPATPRNVVKADPTLIPNKAFLRDIKLEVRHTVSVLIEENEGNEDDDGINDIVLQINWPMKDKDGNYLLYLSDVYVKENLMKENFRATSTLIDPDSLFGYNMVTRTDRERRDADMAAHRARRKRELQEEEPVVNPLSTNCSVPDPGCQKFNVTIRLLKAGSINMKRLEFEMRSILWLPTIINKGDFDVISTAEIVKVGRSLVIPPGSYVEIKTQVSEDINKQKNVLWIIIGSVIGGLIILAILVVVLWKVGFFKRKMPPKDGVES